MLIFHDFDFNRHYHRYFFDTYALVWPDIRVKVRKVVSDNGPRTLVTENGSYDWESRPWVLLAS